MAEQLSEFELVPKISGEKKLEKIAGIQRSSLVLSDKESILFYSSEAGIPKLWGYNTLLEDLRKTKILGLTIFCNVPNLFEQDPVKPDPAKPEPLPLVIVKDDSIILLEQFRRVKNDDPFSRLDNAKDRLSKVIAGLPDSSMKTLWLSPWYMDKLVGVKLEELCKKAKHHNVQLLKPRRANKDNLQLSLNFISLQEFLQPKRTERFIISRYEIFKKFQKFSHHSLTHVPLDVWRSCMDQRPGGIQFPSFCNINFVQPIRDTVVELLRE